MDIDKGEIKRRCVDLLEELLNKLPNSERLEQMELCIRHFENAGCMFSFDVELPSFNPREFAEFFFVHHWDPMSIVMNTMMLHPYALDNAKGAETPEEFILWLLPSDGHLD